MFQKYGSDRIRDLLIDRVNSTANEYVKAKEELVRYDKFKEETKDERLDIV